MTIDRIPFREKSPISEAIRERLKFRSNAMRGNDVSPDYLPSTGKLPDEWAILFRAEKPTYIVISYLTPIAWWSPTLGWSVPDVEYSKTTTKHQNAVRAALRGEEARS